MSADDGVRLTSDAASVLDRVAVLIRAGVAPDRAWWLVFERAGPALSSIAAQLRAGVTLPLALSRSGPPWDLVAAVVQVASTTGAPAAPALDGAASALRDRAAAHRAILVARAGPAASARIVLAMPLLGIVLASAWGAAPVTVLVTTPAGWGCGAAAACLVLLARFWSLRLLTRSRPADTMPGLALELYAVAMSGGGAWRGAEAVVTGVLGSRQPPAAERAHIDEAVQLAVAAGVPVSALLRSAAAEFRRDAAARDLAAAEQLGVRLVLPLGICVLPAFVCVGVIPVVVGLLSSTAAVLHR